MDTPSRIALGLCVALVVGCQGVAPDPDDPGSQDASTEQPDGAIEPTDASVDPEPVDAGPRDAGTVDAGRPDAGLPDAGPPYRGPYNQPGMLITLKSQALGRWIRPDIEGSPASRRLAARREGVGTWEVFRVESPIPADGTYVCLLSYADNKYISAENTGRDPLVANRDTCGAWERFRINVISGSTVSLQAKANSKYVTVEGDFLVASRDTVGPSEQFMIERVVDVFVAAQAFAKNYPDSVKLLTLNPRKDPNPVLVAKEIIQGPILWHYWLLADSTCVPGVGFPGWDDYRLVYHGQWETYSCFGTKPQCNQGTHWSNGFPRTRRYPNIDVVEKSPVNRGDWYWIGKNGDKNACTQAFYSTVDYWGMHYVPAMMDLGGSMGKRWVFTMDVWGTGENFLLDLGPAVNHFDPKYGAVGYAATIYSKIVPDERYYPRICTW